MLKNKQLDMARSVLPSTARKSARDNKRHVNHQYRASVRKALATFDGDDIDDSFIKEGKRKSEMAEAIYDRRSRDKVGPIMRWAASKVKDMPEEDREAYIKKLLPPGLIGDHAFLHISFIDEFDHLHPFHWWKFSKEKYFLERCKNYEKWTARYKWIIRNGLSFDFQRMCFKHFDKPSLLVGVLSSEDFGCHHIDDIEVFFDKIGHKSDWAKRTMETCIQKAYYELIECVYGN